MRECITTRLAPEMLKGSLLGSNERTLNTYLKPCEEVTTLAKAPIQINIKSSGIVFLVCNIILKRNAYYCFCFQYNLQEKCIKYSYKPMLIDT